MVDSMEMSDETVIVRGTGTIFLDGPPLSPSRLGPPDATGTTVDRAHSRPQFDEVREP